MFEYSISGKWLELLKQIGPSVTRAAVVRDTTKAAGTGQFAVIQSAAPSIRVEATPVNMRGAAEIERAIADFARSQWRPDRDRGPLAIVHRNLIITLAARHRLPAVYPVRFFVGPAA